MSSSEAEEIGIDRLYKNYEILQEAKDKITEHEAEYKEILDAIKGNAKEKRLASQFIGKFFKYFPNLADTAIDAQLDLCEDEDIQIRRQAIKDLPQLCKDTKDNTAKIGDILAQLLVVEDASELTQVHLSLQTLAKYDAKGTLAGIFSQILTGDEATRSSCFKFVQTKFRNLGPEVITKEIEEFMIAEIKKILQDVSADEFYICMTILGSTKLGSSVTGHNELVALAIEQAELDGGLGPLVIDDEVVERYIQCANHALPYFSSQVESTKFLNFMCEKFLPLNTWAIIGATEKQDQMQLRLLKVFAEMCKFSGPLEKPSEKIEAIFDVLQEYMPLPPFDSEVPSFQFSHAECLLYALHSLGKQFPEFFAFSNEPNKLKEFRSRLQYLARGTQGYIKKLQESVKGKTAEELKSEENQIKITALKTTSNISTLIRDLFHSPPSFKSVVNLPWVAKVAANNQQVIPYCILDNITYMMGAYWYLACDSLSRSATILAEDFQQALRHIGPAAMVADYRALWLRLSKLCRDTGNATFITFIYLNLYLFFTITILIYGLMSQLSEGFGLKDIGLLVNAMCNITLLFFICDEAHHASQHVRTNFQKKLLMVELSWMNSDAQTEINMFLRATEMNPSNINCGGFFDVNRNLFKSLLATMVTYLVVLLQFQISIPDEALIQNGTLLNATRT